MPSARPAKASSPRMLKPPLMHTLPAGAGAPQSTSTAPGQVPATVAGASPATAWRPEVSGAAGWAASTHVVASRDEEGTPRQSSARTTRSVDMPSIPCGSSSSRSMVTSFGGSSVAVVPSIPGLAKAPRNARRRTRTVWGVAGAATPKESGQSACSGATKSRKSTTCGPSTTSTRRVSTVASEKILGVGRDLTGEPRVGVHDEHDLRPRGRLGRAPEAGRAGEREGAGPRCSPRPVPHPPTHPRPAYHRPRGAESR